MLQTHEREKLVNAIIFFARNTQYLGKIKLFKLLYLLDFAHFGTTGRSVTGLEYHAWKFGPVPVSLYQEWDEPEADLAGAICIKPVQVFDYVRETVFPQAEFDDSHFSKRELRIMTELADRYRDVYSPEMIDVTHAENGAWAKVWSGGAGFDKPIPYTLAIAEGDPNRAVILEAAEEYEATVRTARC
jgi:uncharacterized phage-associated protein